MRILLVNWNDRENPQAGGAEIHLHELFGRIAQWGGGHEIHLIASGWPGCPPRAVVDGIQVTRIGGRHSFAVRGRGAVRAALRQTQFDVVVEDINKIPLFLPTLTRLPFVAIVPHLFGTTAFAEASAPLASIVWAAELPIPWVYGKAAFHAISESTRDDLVRRGIRAERIVVIHPGVDADRYHPDPGTPRAERPTFLYLGRLKRYKGVEFALRAVAAARQARDDITLDICGQGDDRPRLERVAAELGLGDAVRFLGFVSEDEKLRLLRRAWAVVFPSPKEGWGITNVEAAASGTPALASDSPGLRESVQHGVTGYLVPHGDLRALADRMLALAGDRSLVDRLGRAARSFAEGLSWDTAARATLAHIEQTVAARERKR
ncbi:MAG TPA: glycosyltransferase family 4 protein [Gemmatimonadales bacterium]|nr:glycosyltransferase family 4 protein [Gemmatimonadales bacterium]